MISSGYWYHWYLMQVVGIAIIAFALCMAYWLLLIVGIAIFYFAGVYAKWRERQLLRDYGYDSD